MLKHEKMISDAVLITAKTFLECDFLENLYNKRLNLKKYARGFVIPMTYSFNKKSYTHSANLKFSQ